MAADHSRVLSLAGTSIAHATYAQLVAATVPPCSGLMIANNTDQNVTLAVGAAGSEVDLVCVGKGCTAKIFLPIGQIPVGSRLSLQSVGADATTGYCSVSLL